VNDLADLADVQVTVAAGKRPLTGHRDWLFVAHVGEHEWPGEQVVTAALAARELIAAHGDFVSLVT
jgi:hypothetical protein